MVVPLPIGEPSHLHRLHLITAESAERHGGLAGYRFGAGLPSLGYISVRATRLW
jgi:hypothetical protein